eukprot:9476139-Pyramimonas_sp.AAC.1
MSQKEEIRCKIPQIDDVATSILMTVPVLYLYCACTVPALCLYLHCKYPEKYPGNTAGNTRVPSSGRIRVLPVQKRTPPDTGTGYYPDTKKWTGTG